MRVRLYVRERRGGTRMHSREEKMSKYKRNTGEREQKRERERARARERARESARGEREIKGENGSERERERACVFLCVRDRESK